MLLQVVSSPVCAAGWTAHDSDDPDGLDSARVVEGERGQFSPSLLAAAQDDEATLASKRAGMPTVPISCQYARVLIV